MFGNKSEPYVRTGTTNPIHIPRGPESKIIHPGKSYFYVQVKNAQAAFTGPFWEDVHRLIVTSQVNLNHPTLGNEPIAAIQRAISVKKDRAEQLGMSPNLIKLVPAAMSHVSISIDFVLDKHNHLASLVGLINDDAFAAAISLAPGAAAVAKTVGALSQKLLQSFLKPEERDPILEFSGDFNVADGLPDGFYVIFGTRDDRNPLPSPMPNLEIRNDGLLANGQPVTQLSYVVLEVRGLPARTRELSDGAAWESKLRQAESVAMGVKNNPMVDDKERAQSWQECMKLLKDTQLLLSADNNYLYDEATNIIKAAYATCYKDVFDTESIRSSDPVLRGEAQPPDLLKSRAVLNIAPDENIEESLGKYAEDVIETRRALRSAGLT
jgi:hypothetical protein